MGPLGPPSATDAFGSASAPVAPPVGSQLKKLAEQNEVLARNISCLFKTAQAEIQRKDRTIGDLRSQKAA